MSGPLLVRVKTSIRSGGRRIVGSTPTSSANNEIENQLSKMRGDRGAFSVASDLRYMRGIFRHCRSYQYHFQVLR